jgi:hypothetical protein
VSDEPTDLAELFQAGTDEALLTSLKEAQHGVARGMERSRVIAAELDRRRVLAGEASTLSVYTGPPDERQAGDIKPTRFRPRYRALTPEELILHDAIKQEAAVLEGFYNQLTFGRYHALAMTALEESVFWAVKGLTE